MYRASIVYLTFLIFLLVAVESVERAFERREGYGWELGEIYTQKAGGYPADGLTACALVGVIFIPEEYLGFGEKV